MKKVFELDFRGRKIIVENGYMAKQAAGSVLIRYEDTVVLSTTCISKNAKLLSDFFPLMVLYNEKLYSLGKIPGGFIKREGRPSENSTLSARMIDRPLRPLFPENFRNEVQIVNTVLSVDQDNSPEMSALFGSSLSCLVSGCPFDGPVAGVKVGRVDGEFIINPTAEETIKSDIDLTVAGTIDAINMVESSSKEVTEEDMLEALLFAHEAIIELCKFQEKIVKEVGKEKISYETLEITDELTKEVTAMCEADLKAAMYITDKLTKYGKIDEVFERVIAHYELVGEEQKPKDASELIAKVRIILQNVEYRVFRQIIVGEKLRPDGRKMTEIRQLSADIDLLPRTHGSALFTRGETQSLSITTLGSLAENQILDGLEIEETKRFMLHYNFPSFSVGETGRYGAPGRREIGHGALGEKALLQVLPSEDVFPYTIRIVSEILESNGSSSQASICAGCLSLMAAGVPITSPIAGIAMGLITNDDDYIILTDIQGMEDHLGDMDFKVAGTKQGICALQMDIKIKGITKDILKEALDQAKKARLEILKVMADTIKEPRKELSKYAPKMETFMINPAKIKDVIGRGGETITKIILESSNVKTVNDANAVKIDVDDDGRVIIYHKDQDIINKVSEWIKNIVKEVEEGKIYTGKVVTVSEFGCFVELWEGLEGLVHVSELDNKRVEKPSDLFSVGDEIIVKCMGYDKKGRLNLSRKQALAPEIKKDKKIEE